MPKICPHCHHMEKTPQEQLEEYINNLPLPSDMKVDIRFRAKAWASERYYAGVEDGWAQAFAAFKDPDKAGP